MILHATAVATATGQGWRAVLLRGPSGSGKSDLALRLMERGWRLVGDDYVEAWASGAGLFAAPASRLAGVIEARGVGLTGAANLTLADTNEEAANLLALQTRQQLSSTALSLASQADQNVLRLF